MTRSPLRSVLAATILLAFRVSPALATGELVWSVKIEGETATLVQNEFPLQRESADKTTFPFPLSTLRAWKLENRSDYGPHGRGTSIRINVAPLSVNPDGTLAGSSLKFVSPGRASRDLPGRSSFVYLAQPSGEHDQIAKRLGDLAELFPVRALDRIAGRDRPVLEWGLSSDGTRAVAHMEFQTLFLDVPRSKTAGLKVRAIDSRRTYDVAVSKRPERIAAIALTEPDRECIVVFDFDGKVLYEGENRRGYFYRDLFLSPSGETLVFRRDRKGEEPETVALDLGSGRTKVLEGVADGVRYYSLDGTRMAVLWGGRASYYNASDPFHPELLWTYNARSPGTPPPLPAEEVDGSSYPRWLSGGGLGVGNDLIITAAVSDDGSYVALQIRNRIPGGPASLRVVVLDEAMNQVAEPTGATTLEGLQFANKILFLGYQKHPVPVGLQFGTTRGIRAYNFTE